MSSERLSMSTETAIRDALHGLMVLVSKSTKLPMAVAAYRVAAEASALTDQERSKIRQGRK